MNNRVAIPRRARGTAGSSILFNRIVIAHTRRTITLMITPRVRLIVGHVQVTGGCDTHGSLMHKIISTPPAAVVLPPDGTEART